MTHQPAISYSISFHFPFNRAGGRTLTLAEEMNTQPRPTEEEFKAAAEDAFGFLGPHGFALEMPSRYPEDRFQIWFRRGDFVIVVRGEGWGEFTATTIEHTSGVELDIGRLVPKDQRPALPKNRKKWPGQLEQMNRQAKWLATYGIDFLGGDYERFFALARPLPPYKEPISSKGKQVGSSNGG